MSKKFEVEYNNKGLIRAVLLGTAIIVMALLAI
jgi:hypothetical protein